MSKLGDVCDKSNERTCHVDSMTYLFTYWMNVILDECQSVWTKVIVLQLTGLNFKAVEQSNNWGMRAYGKCEIKRSANGMLPNILQSS